jgi:preprotein translocase subunit SecE
MTREREEFLGFHHDIRAEVWRVVWGIKGYKKG